MLQFTVSDYDHIHAVGIMIDSTMMPLIFLLLDLLMYVRIYEKLFAKSQAKQMFLKSVISIHCASQSLLSRHDILCFTCSI